MRTRLQDSRPTEIDPNPPCSRLRDASPTARYAGTHGTACRRAAPAPSAGSNSTNVHASGGPAQRADEKHRAHRLGAAIRDRREHGRECDAKRLVVGRAVDDVGLHGRSRRRPASTGVAAGPARTAHRRPCRSIALGGFRRRVESGIRVGRYFKDHARRAARRVDGHHRAAP